MVKVGELLVEIKAETAKLTKGMNNVRKQFLEFDKNAKRATKTTNMFSNALKFLGGAIIIRGAVRAFKSIIETTIKYQNSLLGLSSVAKSFGAGQEKATAAAKSLARDGLMTVSEAAEGLKNLLAAGFGLPEAIKLMDAFRDSAAFNRQGTLAFGEAIVGATQGIKNQNSIMVDNAGITKNLSVILKESGFTMQDLNSQIDGVAAKQALFNGLLKEAKPFLGDADTLVGELSGKLSTLGSNWREFNVQLGEIFQPVVEAVVESLTDLIGKDDKSGLRGVTFAVQDLITDWTDMKDLLKKKEKSQFLANIVSQLQTIKLLQEAIGGILGGIFGKFKTIRDIIALGGAAGRTLTGEEEKKKAGLARVVAEAQDPTKFRNPFTGELQQKPGERFTGRTPGDIQIKGFNEALTAQQAGQGNIIGDPFFTDLHPQGRVNFQPIITINIQGEFGETKQEAADRLGIILIENLSTLSGEQP